MDIDVMQAAKTDLKEILSDESLYTTVSEHMVNDWFTDYIGSSDVFTNVWKALIHASNTTNLSYGQAKLLFDFIRLFRKFYKTMPQELKHLRPSVQDLTTHLEQTNNLDYQTFFTQSYLFLMEHPHAWPIISHLQHNASERGEDECDEYDECKNKRITPLSTMEVKLLNELLHALPKKLQVPQHMRMYNCIAETEHFKATRALSFVNGMYTTTTLDHDPCDFTQDYIDMQIRALPDTRGLFVGFCDQTSQRLFPTFPTTFVLLPPGMQFVWDKSHAMDNILGGHGFQFYADEHEYIETQVDDANSKTWKAHYRVYTIGKAHQQQHSHLRKQLFV